MALSGASRTKQIPSSKPGDRAAPAYSEKNRRAARPLDEREIRFVRLMQRDLPITPEPFVEVAAELGMSFDEAAAMNREFLESGRMRRFAAVLHHRKAGFGANAMGVWAGPQDDPEELRRVGEKMAGFRAVSHCYQRPSYPDWPYNLFTMVHGKSEDECEEILEGISKATGISDRHSLYSTREFKKVRVRYFTDEETRWESSQVAES